MFNKNLKNIRLQQGLSQKQVADCLLVSLQSVSKWEKGEALPSIEYLPKLAEILKCDINSFFAPISVKPTSNQVLSDFLILENEAIYKETKSSDDITAFVRKYPYIIKETIAFCREIMEHKTMTSKAMQSLLDCSEAEARLFIEHLVNGEMLEKLDIDDTYFVVKDAVDGFIILLKLNQTIYEKSIDDKVDLVESFKEKI